MHKVMLMVDMTTIRYVDIVVVYSVCIEVGGG